MHDAILMKPQRSAQIARTRATIAADRFVRWSSSLLPPVPQWHLWPQPSPTARRASSSIVRRSAASASAIRSRAIRLWQRPDLTVRQGGVVSYRRRNDEGMLAYVRAGGARIFSIEVEGPVFRTRRGDGYGTRIAQFRLHWPGARRHRECCAAAVSHYAVHGMRPATVLVFTFASGRLTRVAFMTGSNFEACYVHDCD
jgi:hypothetical protein